MKEDFFSKFKDHNKELEKILEDKDFSQEVKNLLLSLFYKLRTCYDDYFVVKRNCKSKQEFLETIFEKIKDCNNIELVSPSDLNFENIKVNGLCEVDINFKTIKALPNELALLLALFQLEDFKVYVKDEYNVIKESIPYLLNTAYDMENIEVIRDFNSWSWNTLVEEIRDIRINLIYQNLKMALNMNIFEKIKGKDIDIIKQIRKTLLKQYNEDTVYEFLNLIFKLSIIICVENNKSERDRLYKEKEKLDRYLNKVNDKKLFVEDISEEKKKLTKELKQIDLILNNKNLLEKEFERRNSQLPEYNRIFNASHLAEILQRDRQKILSKIEVCNKKVDPKNYLENREKIQEDYNLIEEISFEKDNDIYNTINKLQEIFINDILIKRIEKASTKDELINCMYELRYYNFLPYNKEQNIKDIENLNKHIEKAKEILVNKLYDYKIINTLSTNRKNDVNIIKNIFDLKIINMEDIYMQIEQDYEQYIIRTYDEKETIESQFEISLQFNKKDKIKLNRKIRLFI